MESMTRHLANRVANIKFEDLPQETIQMTKQYILDYLGVSIDDIKSYGSPKIGLLDSSSNILYNFTEFIHRQTMKKNSDY